MKLYVFEGSVEELSEVAVNLGISKVSEAVPPVPLEEAEVVGGASVTPIEDQEPVSVTFARRVLKRREISEPMMAVLKALYDAKDGYVGSNKLCEVSNYTKPQFAGLMGAFGRRISHTEGYDQETFFFTYVWDEEGSEWRYSIPPSVREALVKEKLI